MFKVLFTSLVFLFTPAFAYAEECPKGSDTQEEFFAYVAASNFVVFTLSDEGQKKLIEFVNRNRVTNGLAPFSLKAKFYFSNISVNESGVVWMENGCVVAGSGDIS